jgi:alkylhydroperoxidase family enzyme
MTAVTVEDTELYRRYKSLMLAAGAALVLGASVEVLVAAVDELVRDAVVSDETWAALAAELSEQQLMDVVFTVGAYDLLAMAFRTFGVPLDDDLYRK